MFVQKFKFILMKMYKNCCHQSCCSFWLRYAPNRLSAGASPQTPLGELTDPLDGLEGGAPGEREGGRGEEKEEGEGGGGKGVPECPNRELASLSVSDKVVNNITMLY